MIYPMDSEVEHEKAVVETLQKYDTDHDGFISYTEYRGKGGCVTPVWGTSGRGACVEPFVCGSGMGAGMCCPECVLFRVCVDRVCDLGGVAR